MVLNNDKCEHYRDYSKDEIIDLSMNVIRVSDLVVMLKVFMENSGEDADSVHGSSLESVIYTTWDITRHLLGPVKEFMEHCEVYGIKGPGDEKTEEAAE